MCRIILFKYIYYLVGMCTHTHLHPLKKNTPKCQQKISLCDEIEWPLCYYFCISVFSEVFIVTMASLALKVHT